MRSANTTDSRTLGTRQVMKRMGRRGVVVAVFLAVCAMNRAEELKQQSLFFHSSNLPGSPVTGNRLAVDEEGRVYFQTMHTVLPNNKAMGGSWDGGYLVYSPEGELLNEFWAAGKGFHYHDINVMNGRIYLPCSSVGPSVFVFDAEGQVLTRINVPQSTSASGAPDNSIWIINQPARRVKHYDQFGKLLGSIPAGSTPEQYPVRVRVSPKDGRIYIDTVGVGVEVFAPDGKREAKIPDGPLYNCLTDGNVVVGRAIYTPTGEKVKDLRLENFTSQIQDMAVDPEGNVYVAVRDPEHGLGFMSFDPAGKFRFARGADFDRLEAVLSDRVLEPKKAYQLSAAFETSRDKGYLAPSQILPGDKREPPKFSAFLKSIRGGAWVGVELTGGEDGEYVFTLPDGITSGVYTLRLTAASEAEPVGSPAVSCDFLVAVPGAGTLGSITILSDRNRSVWRCGEEVPFYLVVRSRKGRSRAAFQVEIVGVGPAKNLNLDLAAGANTVSLVIPKEVTAALWPGDYTVICREADAAAGNFAESSWNFHLASAVRPTKFQMVHYPEVIEDDLPVQTAVSSVGVIARRGFNHDLRAVYAIASRREDMNLRATSLPLAEQLRAILEHDPRLPSPEVLYPRHRFEQYLETTTKDGIKSRLQLIFNEMMIPYLPEMWPKEQRQVQVFTQFASRYPSFVGWSFTGHAHVQSFADPASASTLVRLQKRFAQEFCATSEQQPGKWFDYYNRLIPNTLQVWNRAAHEVNPLTDNTASLGEYISAAIGKYPPWIYDEFKLQLTHIQEEQWHEPTIYPFMTDFVRCPGKRLVSLQSQLQGAENGQYLGREYFLALSRGLQGVGISQSGLQSLYAPIVPYAPFSSMHKLFTVYGDFFHDLQPANDIAVLMSYSQEKADGIKSWGWSEQVLRVFELYSAALYAHLPVSILYEEDLAALGEKNNALLKPKVVLITGIKTNLPSNVLQGLAAFQARGGVVVVDAGTTVPIDGARRLALDFNELWRFLSKSHTYWNSDSWRLRVERACLPEAAPLRTAIGAATPLVVDVDNPRCVVGLQQCGSARYLFLANMDRLPMKPEQMWHFTMYEPTTLPAKPTVTLSGAWKNYAIYDLFAGRKVEPRRQGNTVTFQADLASVLGRVYALLPASIGSVSLSAPRGVKLGSVLPIQIQIMTASSEPFPGLVPVEVTLRDAAGKALEIVYRAVDPEGLQCELPTPLNGPTGNLQVLVRELISGCGTRAVVAGTSQTLKETMRLAPAVEAFEADSLQKLLTDGKHFAILREEAHGDLAPAVEVIKTALAASKKDVVVLDAKAFEASTTVFDGVIVPWLPTCRSPYFDYLEKLNSMPRRLSASWPGRGRGVIELVYAPRKYRENLIIIGGGNVNGLSQTVVRFAELGAIPMKSPSAAAKQPPTLAYGKTLPRRVLPDRASSLFGPMLVEAVASPNGQYVALAAQSWGNNLFLLNNRGRVISAIMAGKDFPAPMSIGELRRSLTMLDSGDLFTRLADLQPPYLFLGHYKNGRLLERYAMMGLRHIGPADSGVMTHNSDCSFAVSPDGSVVAAGNYGVVAFDRTGRKLWQEDYWPTYRTLNSLIVKMTADVAVSADGKFLALLKQRETNPWANPEWKPSLVASVRQLSTGKEVWRYTFSKGTSFGKVLSTDGNRMVIQTDETLFGLENGRMIWRYDAPIMASDYYPGIYHPYMKAVCHDARHVLIGGKEGSLIFVDEGKVKWGESMMDSVFDVAAMTDGSCLAASSAAGLLVCYDASGRRLWARKLPSHAALAFMGNTLATADARGMVRYFDRHGKLRTSVDLAPYAWRPKLVHELTMLETAHVRKATIPAWQETPIPAGRTNLALAAKIEVKAPEGWYSSGTVENPAGVLNNGKTDDIEKPWLSLNECYWDASAQRLPQITVTFDQPTTVQAVVVKEHTSHPEAIPREVTIEAQGEDGTWKTVRVDLNVSGLTHTHTFTPIRTKAVRYTVVADLFNNLWMTEVEVY